MNLPDFLIIGAQKAGTTWLHHNLLQNPGIWMPPPKELHFLDRLGSDAALDDREKDLIRRKIRRERHKDEPDRAFIRFLRGFLRFDRPDLVYYDHAFSWPVEPGIRKGEATPAYFDLTEAQIAAARAILRGDTKLIAIIRDPLDRELSQLRMFAGRAFREGTGPATVDEWLHFYRRMVEQQPRGDYREGILRWQAHFGAASLMLIPFARIRTDPAGLIRDVEAFIGVPHHAGYHRLTERIHATDQIDMPAEAVELARRRVAGQHEFLVDHLGKPFADMTK